MQRLLLRTGLLVIVLRPYLHTLLRSPPVDLLPRAVCWVLLLENAQVSEVLVLLNRYDWRHKIFTLKVAKKKISGFNIHGMINHIIEFSIFQAANKVEKREH